MAEIKKSSTRAAPTKKAAVKKAVTKSAPAAVAKPVEAVQASGLSAADYVTIADIAAKAAAGAVKAALAEDRKDRPIEPPPVDVEIVADPLAALAEIADSDHVPGGKSVEPVVYDTPALTPEAIAAMSPEQVADYNQREANKLRSRKARQKGNLKDLAQMGTAERMRALAAPRDPSVIRTVAPDDWDGNEDDLVTVIGKRRIGLGGSEMTDVDEKLYMHKSVAQTMQKSGIIEVVF